MRSYWQSSYPNRLAEDGEELVLYKLAAREVAFVCPCDAARFEAQKNAEPEGFWAKLRDMFSPALRSMNIPSVRIREGARLLLFDLPSMTQESLYMGREEEVVFTELSNRNCPYRNALVLPNGTRVLLQDLPPGIHAIVLRASPEHGAAGKSKAEAFAA